MDRADEACTWGRTVDDWNVGCGDGLDGTVVVVVLDTDAGDTGLLVATTGAGDDTVLSRNVGLLVVDVSVSGAAVGGTLSVVAVGFTVVVVAVVGCEDGWDDGGTLTVGLDVEGELVSSETPETEKNMTVPDAEMS
uniref:Uncharacterized protein n=1 Tax=Cyclophora tenuis TaxID=216820 RepID=A0A6U1Q9I0_CYCTE|mmetsp:Transcript_1703/g.2991  ORF Transcript_1703/g.2991 Transcript_1703/m.2991 type:complete len:136 (+) Transcript_1703:25-432(+)